LFISNPSNYEFLSIYGYATYSRDRQKIDELWNDIAKAWFPEGKDDPGHSHQVRTRARAYWDTKNGKLVSLIKIAASAIAGKTFEEGVEGRISM
jgi:general stress protein 26